MHVDLGCGNDPRGDINIDVSPVLSKGVIYCNLGFDSIPLEDNVADKVTSYDFVEHVPFYIYLNKKGEKYSPMKQLFVEVTRILKPGGTFFIKVPQFPSTAIFQAPVHMSVWTKYTAEYFLGPQIWDEKIIGELELIQNKELDPAYLEIIYKKK